MVAREMSVPVGPDVFAALADATRRSVLREVSERGSATATELAGPLGVSRQAVAKHLAVLAGARLVAARRVGRETRFRPTPAPLGEAISWMTAVGGAPPAAVGRRGSAEAATSRASRPFPAS